MSMMPAIGVASKLSSLHVLAHEKDTAQLPVLFLGHGSPMNAIEENEFVQGFRDVAKTFDKPNAVLVVSAHWETRGTWVTAIGKPKTIHDFGGFPQTLFDVQYPAPGNPALAQEIIKDVSTTKVLPNYDWGLDHGAWSVVKHLYPNADVPVLQLSIDYTKPPAYHYELGKQLHKLRQKGVLIVGSGNIVHNLRRVAWDNLDTPGFAFDWAQEAREMINAAVLANRFDDLINYQNFGAAAQMAIPTPEHYYPLLYTMALKGARDEISLFNDMPVGGSLTMTSVRIGE